MRAIDYIGLVLIAISIVIISVTSGTFLLGSGGQTVFNGKVLEADSYTNGTLGGEDITFAHYGETYSDKFEPLELVHGTQTTYVVADHSVKGFLGESENVYVSDDYIEVDLGENATYKELDITFIEEVTGSDTTYQIYLVNDEYYAIPNDGQATVMVDGNPILLQSVGGKLRAGEGSALSFDASNLTGPAVTLLVMFALGSLFVWKRKDGGSI